MLHTNNPIIKHKAGLLNLAEELSNVSKACEVMGVSRDTFYRYQELVEDANYFFPFNQGVLKLGYCLKQQTVVAFQRVEKVIYQPQLC